MNMTGRTENAKFDAKVKTNIIFLTLIILV